MIVLTDIPYTSMLQDTNAATNLTTSLMPFVDPSSPLSIPVGIIIGLLASFVQSLGLTIQRKSHVIEQSLPEHRRRVEHRRPYVPQVSSRASRSRNPTWAHVNAALQVVVARLRYIHFLKPPRLSRPNSFASSRHPSTSWSRFIALECLLRSSDPWGRLLTMDDPRHHPHRWWCHPYCCIRHRPRTDSVARRSARVVQKACLCGVLFHIGLCGGRQPCSCEFYTVHLLKGSLSDTNLHVLDSHHRVHAQQKIRRAHPRRGR